MNAQGSSGGAPKPFVFSSDEGFKLCRQILEARLPYSPHDFQVEGLCKVFDHIDLFAILAMGSGKTGFLSMYMLVVLAIKKDPSLCPTAKFPDNPCLLAIRPTKYLEHQMVSQIQVDIMWTDSHLLNTWGASWRKAFQQIGWVQARFTDVLLIALTATMRGGKHIASV